MATRPSSTPKVRPPKMPKQDTGLTSNSIEKAASQVATKIRTAKIPPPPSLSGTIHKALTSKPYIPPKTGPSAPKAGPPSPALTEAQNQERKNNPANRAEWWSESRSFNVPLKAPRKAALNSALGAATSGALAHITSQKQPAPPRLRPPKPNKQASKPKKPKTA
jgi:hypothetical protein